MTTPAGVDVLLEPFNNSRSPPWTTGGPATTIVTGRTGTGASVAATARPARPTRSGAPTNPTTSPSGSPSAPATSSVDRRVRRQSSNCPARAVTQRSPTGTPARCRLAAAAVDHIGASAAGHHRRQHLVLPRAADRSLSDDGRCGRSLRVNGTEVVNVTGVDTRQRRHLNRATTPSTSRHDVRYHPALRRPVPDDRCRRRVQGRHHHPMTTNQGETP